MWVARVQPRNVDRRAWEWERPGVMGAPLAAVILAAGQGTRMKSDRAKVLHEVGGLPLVAHPVRLALALGAKPVVLVVGHQAAQVEAELDRRFPGLLRFELQKEQLGTGHAMREGMKGLQGFEGRVLILYGDVPLLTEDTVRALQAELDTHDRALVAVTMVLDDPTGYGRIVRDASGQVLRVVEQKDATPEERLIRECNAGIYLVDAALLREGLARLTNDNAQREYYLTDVIAFAAQSPRGASTVVVKDAYEVMGANDRVQLADLGRALRERINRRWMLAGVTLIDPATTYIEPDVVIGRDTVLGPNVHLRGKTTLGAGVQVDTGCVVTDSVVGDRVELRAASILEEARVSAGALIGPFARLRPGAEVLEEAHVGNFVELKKTRLGKGAKANHLAYLGDAIIGDGSNVGAGTITCNYDGYGKYLTEIGRGVFVGSNSTLVAPLKIGDEAYVAAGSTLTDEVAPHALAFGRARQTDKPGRAPALRDEAKRRAAEAKAKK